MKKVYFLLILLCLGLTGFSATWYSNPGGGNADVLTNWWSNPGGTGTNPANFTTVGDVWMMNNDMTTSGDWTIAGSLTLNAGTFTPNGNISIGTLGAGGDLTMTGASVFSSSDGSDITVTLYGNLNVSGTSSWANPPAYTQIIFANTSSSLGSPQTITWASTTLGIFAGITINAGVTVQLLTNVTLPTEDDQSESLNGTLVCDNFILNTSSNSFVMNNGATLYTQNTGGVDATITGAGFYTFQSGTNYVFNGTAPQVTGSLMPTTIASGGSVTVNNVAGISLSQTTTFADGATLALTSGNLTIGSNDLIMGPASTLTGVFSSTSMVIANNTGQLKQQFNGDASFLFPIGDDASNYTPITLSVTGSGYDLGAYMGVNVTALKHPNNANVADYLNRYWSVSSSGISGLSYSVAAATYVPGDVTGTEANISMGEYAGSLPWMKFGPTNTLTHTLSSSPVTNTGDFSGISTPAPVVSANADTAVCGVNSVALTATGTGDGPLTYTWAPADGLSGTTGPSVTATPAITTTYTVTVTDGNGFTAAAMTTITVNPVPDAITGTAIVCVSSVTTLNDDSSGGTWTSSDILVATAGSAGMVTGVSAGTPVITYTLPAGCFVTQSILVNPLPAVSGGANVAICVGTSTPLTATGSAAVYSWSPASGLSCTNCSNPVASPTVPTTYTVTGTGIDSIVYNQSFTGGSNPTTQCPAWDAFRASLLGTYNYVGFTMRGSMNTTGISCTDPVVAAAVANALMTGTEYSGSSDGQTWSVGIGCGTGCGPVVAELANQGSCSCASGYSVRPSIGNTNWGGIGGVTCGASSQTMEVDFYYLGCSNTATVTVSVNPVPNVYNVTGGGGYCAGGAGVHDNLSNSDAGISYQLFNGLSTTGSPINGTGSAIDFGLQTAGGYYTVVATDTVTGCNDIMNGADTVTIIPVVVPSVSISINTPDTICAGRTTIFTATPVNGGSAPAYHWMVNGTAVGTDSAAYWYTPADSNMISVAMISSHVCAIPDTVIDSVSMRVFPNGFSAVHIVSTPSDTVCMGTPVTLVAHPTFGGYGPSYIWIKNTAIVSAASSFTYTPADSDNIYCIMVSNYLCLLDTVPATFSDAIYMNVEAPIVPSVVITGHPSVYVARNSPDTLVATVTNGGISPSYQWYYNGSPVPGATSATWIRDSFSVNRNDSVSCMVTRKDACGLSTINSVVIRVGVGVQSLAVNGSLAIIPNPNKGSFSIRGSLGMTTDEEVTLTISDMLGQIVYNNKVLAKSGNIDELVQLNDAIANGMYILSVHSENVNNVFRFVVER